MDIAKAIVASTIILCATAILITRMEIRAEGYYDNYDIMTYHSDPDNM